MAQTITIDLTPDGRRIFQRPFLYFSQGDVGQEFAINLNSRFGVEIPAGATVKIEATKPSGFGFSETGVLSDGTATFTTADIMTDEAGHFPVELSITASGKVLGTANFNFMVEPDPHPEGTTDGQAEEIIPELTQLVERVEDAASSVLDRQTVTNTLPAGSQASYSFDEETNTQTFGIPQGEAGAGSAGVVANAYSASSTYVVGDYVIHNSNLYRCTTAITTAEAFTSAHWTRVVLGDDVSDLKSALHNTFGTMVIVDKPLMHSTNMPSAVTDNGDGTYTIGTNDYGNILFDPRVRLSKGAYYLYGVPNGYSFLSTGTSHTDAIAQNSNSQPKLVVINDETINYYLGFRISAKASEPFTISPFLKKVMGANVIQDYVIKEFEESQIEWEYGYYGENDGIFTPFPSSNPITIASQPDLFIQVCKGSFIALKTVANDQRVRVCKYSKPSDDSFIERIRLTNNVGLYFNEDCYIRIDMLYSDVRAITDISDLTDALLLNIIQFVKDNSDESDEPTTDEKLPTSWSNKIQAIQEAQGTKFTFAIQTDTHYYNGYGDDAGKNLKLMTNYVGFDFVANLGDVIRGYADETIDSDENMRAAMTEIMHRYIKGISCPFLIAMGNHDMNPMWASAFGGEKFSNAELWGRMFKPSFNTNPKAITQTGKMYYYTDYDDVRVIVLNTQDGNDQAFGIGDEQLIWFTNVALDTEKWVLVLSHVPLVDGWSVGSNYVSSYANVVSALQTFKANNGKVIGCMSGHTHLQENKTVNGILYVTFRNGGNYGEIVQIDIANKAINTITCGFSGNRSFTFS